MADKLDVLAFGAHPDDCEIGAGAFLLKMKKLGYRTGMITLTEGDMGKGTPEIRRAETLKAAEILKVDVVEIHNFGDCRLDDNHENRVMVAGLIRKYQPEIILAPYYGIEPGRGLGHSDHIVCGNLVTHAANFAHLSKFPAEGKPHAIKKILYYFINFYQKPSILVPVDEEIPEAVKALQQHKSQFNIDLENAKFPTFLETNARVHGAMIGAKFAVPFILKDPIAMEDPIAFIRGTKK